MKIVWVHNYYQQAGGEDEVVAAEQAQLQRAGHVLIPYYKDNQAIPPAGEQGRKTWLRLCAVSLRTIWNHRVYREIRALLKKERPDVVHCHNIFPLISPAIYWACAAEQVPVVQTVHNYRLLCLNAFLYRFDPSMPLDARVCELCVRRGFKWPGIRYACYRNHRAGSSVVAAMLWIHRVLGTWTRKVDAYLALTEFQKQKLIEGGVPPEKIQVKPNTVPAMTGTDDERATVHIPSTSYALFAGRLSPEKGGDLLLQAWAQTVARAEGTERPRLVVVGDGPERTRWEAKARREGVEQSVSFVGRKSKSDVAALMRHAAFLVMPSQWYETFGLVVLEAAREGVPAMVPSPGAAAELVDDGVSGWVLPMADAKRWSDQILWAFRNPAAVRSIGEAAQSRCLPQSDSARNVERLCAVYDSVRKSKGHEQHPC